MWKISIQFATIDSKTEMQEVSVAKIAEMKNSTPTTVPAGPIASNTLGKDTNIRLGPTPMPSVPENTNTAGMIITPASSATPVSKNSICETDLLRSTSGFTYEP